MRLFGRRLATQPVTPVVEDEPVESLEDDPGEPERLHVRRVDSYLFGAEWQCDAGQRDRPVGCERHQHHHWCAVCEGWYGVPHEGPFGIHDGPNAHPSQSAHQCACRPCKQATGRESTT